MIRRYLLDANVVIRFLVQDHAEHAKSATKLFQDAENGEVELILMPWIIAEIVYTLAGSYGVVRSEISKRLKAIMSAVGVITEERAVLADAFDRYASKNVDFADALLAAESKALNVAPASFDRDLDKFPDIQRYEP